MASISYINKFYQKLKDWPTAIALDNLWQIYMFFPNSLAKADELLKEYEGEASSLQGNPYQTIIKNSGESGDVGCFYARTVTLPTETCLVEQSSGNGYLNPLISKGRTANSDVVVSFIETHVSVESLFRTWVKLIGCYGLIYREDINLHGSMKIELLSQQRSTGDGGPAGQAPRRILHFESLVPSSVSGQTYTQQSLGNAVSFNVNFKFERYKITHPE